MIVLPMPDTRTTFVVIGLLCLCIVMQMLGAPMTLWDAQSVSDPFGSSVVEGFSIPVEFQPQPAPLPLSFVAVIAAAPFTPLFLHDLFQPPRSIR